MSQAVYLEGEGAILPDGRFVTDWQLRVLVGLVADVCEAFNRLPPETQIVLAALAAVFGDGEAQ